MCREDMTIGLVLSGGGGKGSYQIGVWKALNELGITPHIHAVAGTSVGALNAVLFKQGDIELAEHIWTHLSSGDILTLSAEQTVGVAKEFITHAINKNYAGMIASTARYLAGGVFTREKLVQISKDHIDWDQVVSPGMDVHVTAFQCLPPKAIHFNLCGLPAEECTPILLASSAIPSIFPPETIHGKNYLDGGIRCNTPVEALAGKGYDLIIAVLLSNNTPFDPNQFPQECVLPIFPQESLGNFIKGTLDFQGAHAQERIKKGYEDTLTAFRTSPKSLAGGIDLDQLQDIAKAHRELWQSLQGRTPKPKNEQEKNRVMNLLSFKKNR